MPTSSGCSSVVACHRSSSGALNIRATTGPLRPFAVPVRIPYFASLDTFLGQFPSNRAYPAIFTPPLEPCLQVQSAHIYRLPALVGTLPFTSRRSLCQNHSLRIDDESHSSKWPHGSQRLHKPSDPTRRVLSVGTAVIFPPEVHSVSSMQVEWHPDVRQPPSIARIQTGIVTQREGAIFKRIFKPQRAPNIAHKRSPPSAVTCGNENLTEFIDLKRTSTIPAQPSFRLNDRRNEPSDIRFVDRYADALVAVTAPTHHDSPSALDLLHMQYRRVTLNAGIATCPVPTLHLLKFQTVRDTFRFLLRFPPPVSSVRELKIGFQRADENQPPLLPV